jgi:glycogen operon protein
LKQATVTTNPRECPNRFIAAKIQGSGFIWFDQADFGQDAGSGARPATGGGSRSDFINTPIAKTVIYEAHIKGFSKLWDVLPEKLRGTYLGLGSPQAIEYIKRLGMTAVELLPVHHRIDSQHLNDKGLSDYWGYNSIGFFAPDCRFASSGCLGEQVTEFKTMVRNLHAAGIEVILDVVYNHTSEGNHLGPTLSFRGLDNAVYYRLTAKDPRYYMDYTGTGNTLAVYLPNPLQLVMDSLRYWIKEMHVDGFRFDLAATLARELHDVNQFHHFSRRLYAGRSRELPGNPQRSQWRRKPGWRQE